MRLRLVHPGQGEAEVDHHPVARPRQLAALLDQHSRRHPPLLTLDVDEDALSHLVDSLDDLSLLCCIGRSCGKAERSPAGESDGERQLIERRRKPVLDR